MGEGEERGVRRASWPLPTPICSSVCNIAIYLAMFLDVLVLCRMSVQEEMFLTSTVGIAATANPI